MREISYEKEMGGCAIAGIMSEEGRLFGPDLIVRMMASMRERSNGLGGGFAAYGIYPDKAGLHALHVMFDHRDAMGLAERIILENCRIVAQEPIPTRPSSAVKDRPVLHRYFVDVKKERLEENGGLGERDIIVETVMGINRAAAGAFVFSSGKNMGIFKGVGFPEEIAEFYRLDDYEAYIWLGHGRFPTNTPGWWGGAHPFGLLDWAVVHNGEISSYGVNRRYLENSGYLCTLQTDTEVIAYLFDLLVRKHGLPVNIACMAMAPPFWSQIERMPEEERKLATAVRTVYSGALLNGPFSVVTGFSEGMIGLNDRTKLRPMVAARKDEMLFIASEEAAVQEVCADPQAIWHPEGGVPVIGRLREPGIRVSDEEAGAGVPATEVQR